jgi:hypothetical protein
MKKKIPLQVLETIEPYVNKNGKSFESINPDSFLLKFVDKDDKSDFYFYVENYKMEQGFLLLVNYKPKSKQTTENLRTWIKADSLSAVFGSWIELLEGYEKVKTVFDDPILEAFADEYFTEFEVIDDDAETKPFSTKQILFLDSHLENIEKKIDKYKTESNSFEIEQIKTDANELRNNLSRKSKKWVIKRLSKVWAQIAKQGPKLIKEFLTETKKYVIKEGIKFIIEKGPDLIN